MIKQHVGPKLVGPVSLDTTAIEAREKPFRKEPKDPQGKPKRKRGRPRQGEAKPEKEPKRLDLQIGRNLAEKMADLPTRCDVGTKRNAKGYKTSWTGYRFHIDLIDGDIPVSAILNCPSANTLSGESCVSSIYRIFDLFSGCLFCRIRNRTMDKKSGQETNDWK